MKRLLFISISSPPKSGPESLQTGKYIKGLSKYFNIDLITSKTTKYGWNKSIGENEKLLLPYVQSTIELRSYSSRLASKIKTWLPTQIKFPDDQFHFHQSSTSILKQITHIPDVIYSRSSPLSSNILGYKLKEKINRPWVMHLSDPWVDNPFLKSNRKRNESWEAQCISKADLVTVTNERYQHLLKEKYPANQNKIELSYNVYEPSEVKHFDLNKPLTFIYFGNFYGNRNPSVLLGPLSQVYIDSPKDFNNVNVLFYGNIDSDSKKIIERFNLPFVHYKGYIPSARIADLANDAAVLVNIEDHFSELNDILFLPSKVMDYIAYQRLILSISSNRSPSKEIIDKKYGHVFEHENTVEIVNFIKNTLRAYSLKDHNFFQVQRPDPRFSSDFQTEALVTNILEIL